MNFDATILNGKVGIGAIVYDSNGNIMLAMERYFPMVGSVELIKALPCMKVSPKLLKLTSLHSNLKLILNSFRTS